MHKLLLLASLFAATLAFSQHDSVTIGPNSVRVTARHCQKYARWVPEASPSTAIFPIAYGHYEVDQKACAADPATVYMTHTSTNLDTNLAKDWSAYLMSSPSGQPAAGVGNYMALSVSGTVAATDCAASATPATANCNMNGGASSGTYEISTSGLVRHVASFTRTAIGTYTLNYTWTAGSAQDSLTGGHGTPAGAISSAGVVVGGTAGTGPVLFENTFTPINMAINDTLQLLWTIQIS
jgi:hypothetical protein